MRRRVLACGGLAFVIVSSLLFVGPRAAADASTDTTEADFLAGTISDLIVTSGGDVVLAPGSEQLTRLGMVLDHGPPGSPDSVRASNPFVFRESDGSYKMWYVGMDSSPRNRMMFADSADGITWTKRGIAIDIQVPPWNFDAIGSVSVLKEGTTYHMWFYGGFWTSAPCGSATYWGRIYHATSTNGLAWSIQGIALGVGPSGAWDCGLVNAPWVSRDPQGTYHMYYSGWDGTTSRIGLATSAGYTGFVRHAANPLVQPGPPGAWDDAHVVTTSGLLGTGSMYYDASDGVTWAIGAASSPDGVTWTKEATNPILRQSSPPAWDSSGVVAPSRVSGPSGTRLYYAGADGTYLRIGLAQFALSNFTASGTLLSRVHGPGSEGTTWESIAWNADVPGGTSLDVFVRVGNASAGTWSSWTRATNPGGSTLALPRFRDFQYRVDFATTDDSVSPTLHDVTVTYTSNRAPSASPSFPSGGAWLQDSTPTFAWDVSDPEGDAQTAFEVQAGTDPAFVNPVTSGARVSAVSSWQPPPLGDGVWHWRVRVRDSYGSWGPWSSESFGIDGTPPGTAAVGAGTLGVNGWYTSGVSVTLAATDATSGVATTTYRVDGGPWQAYGGPISLSGDGIHTVAFYSADIAGNTEGSGFAMFPIDTSSPQTLAALIGTVGSGGWYTSAVAVALDRSDATSGLATTSYRVDGGSWQTYVTPVLVSTDGMHIAEFYSTDRAGLVEAVRSVAFQIDTIAPDSTASLAGSLGTNGWYRGPVTVTLSGSDGMSGLSAVRYRVDGGVWQPYGSPFSVTGEGVHEVEFFASDNAGLQGPAQSIAFRIDATPPVTSATLFGQLGGGGFYTTAVTFSLSAVDATSGVSATRYRVDGGSWQSFAAPVDVSGDGTHLVEYDSTDAAGVQEVTRSVAFTIDTTAPVSAAEPDGVTGENGWFTGAPTVSLSAADATSGIASIRYRVDEGTWQTYSAPFLVSGDGVHTIEFHSIDVAGLDEVPKSIAVAIDATAPVSVALPSATMGGSGFYITPVSVTLAATDATSGAGATQYRVDGGSWQPYDRPFLVSGDGAHAVEFYSTDRAGVIEPVRSELFEIDTTPPTTTATLSGPRGVVGFFTGPVTVSLAGTDVTSGVFATQYRLDGGTWASYSGPFLISESGAHSVEFRSTDHAGLEEPMQAVSFSIDTAVLSATGPYGPSVLVLLVAVLAAFFALLVGAALGRRKGRKEASDPEAPEQ